MSKKSFWPRWFPYPISWIKAFVLLFLFSLTIWLLYFLGLWTMLISETFATIKPLLGFLIAIPFIQVILIAYFYHIFGIWKKYITLPRKWPRCFPTWISWREGINGIIIIIISTLFSILIMMPWIYYHRNNVYKINNPKIAEIITLIWFVSSAYIYHYDYLIREWYARILRESFEKRKQQAAKKQKHRK